MKNTENSEKFDALKLKYGFYRTDFHKSHKCSTALCGDFYIKFHSDLSRNEGGTTRIHLHP
jgi:hypothetical protein